MHSFGYQKYDSVTLALFEIKVPSFDVLHNTTVYRARVLYTVITLSSIFGFTICGILVTTH